MHYFRFKFLQNHKRELCWLLLCGFFIVLPFSNILFDSERSLIFRDLLGNFMPNARFWLASVNQEGAIPHWNPLLFAGTPYWADLKTAVLHPLKVILLIFGAENFILAFNYYVFAHFPLLFFGMFQLLRNLKLEQAICFIFALLYTLSGAAISSLNMLNLLAAQVLIPFFILYSHLWLQNPLAFFSKSFVGLACCLALPFFIAAPEFSYFFSLYLILKLTLNFSRQALASFCLLTIVTLGLAAAVFIPGMDHFLDSTRSIVGNTKIAHHVFHPYRIVEFFLPQAFGNPLHFESYAANKFTSLAKTELTLFVSFYFGATALLGLTGFFLQYKKRWIVSIILVFLLLILAFERFFFINLYQFFYSYFPQWKIFKHAEKLILFVSFAAVIAQAIGWQFLFSYVKNIKNFYRLIAIQSLLIVLSLGLSLFWIESIEVIFYSPAARYFLFFLFGQVLLLFLVRKYKQLWNLRYLILCLIVATDLTIHASGLVGDQAKLLIESKNIRKIQANLQLRSKEIQKGAAFRISNAMVMNPERLLEYLLVESQLNFVAKHAYLRATTMAPNIGVLHGLHHIGAKSVLRDSEHNDLYQYLLVHQRKRFLSIFGAYYVADFLDNEQREVSIIINQNALPYLLSPQKIEMVGNRGKAVELVSNPELSLKDTVVIEQMRESSLKNQRITNIKILERKTSSIELELSVGEIASHGPAYIVLNESFHRYWKAYVGDRELEIYRANAWAMAVNIARDCHQNCKLSFRYRNPLIYLGILISVITVMALCLGFFIRSPWYKMRKDNIL